MGEGVDGMVVSRGLLWLLVLLLWLLVLMALVSIANQSAPEVFPRVDVEIQRGWNLVPPEL